MGELVAATSALLPLATMKSARCAARLGRQKRTRIAAASSVFDDLQECVRGERLVQTDIEEPGQVFAAVAVSSHRDNEGSGKKRRVLERTRDSASFDTGQVLIEKSHVERAVTKQVQCSLPIVRHNGAVTNAVQQKSQTVRDDLIIVNNEHFHSRFPITRRSGSANNPSYVIRYY